MNVKILCWVATRFFSPMVFDTVTTPPCQLGREEGAPSEYNCRTAAYSAALEIV
jgi:hypothetical protein